MKLFYQYTAIFVNFAPSSSHLYSLQVDNFDSNSRLVVDEDDNGKFRPERVDQFGIGNVRTSAIKFWCRPRSTV